MIYWKDDEVQPTTLTFAEQCNRILAKMARSLTDDDLDIFNDVEESANLPVAQSQPQGEHLPVQQFKTDFKPLAISKDTLDKEIKGDINRALLEQEFHNADVYIENIHKMFNFATTTGSFNSLIRNSLMIQKQRRASLDHALKISTASQTDTLEYDPITGDLISKKT